MNVQHCGEHARYRAGCGDCKKMRKLRQAGPDGDSNRRHMAARSAAHRRLAAAHPDEFRQYLNEELDTRARQSAAL